MSELFHKRVTSTGTAVDQGGAIRHLTAAGANNSDGRLIIRDTPSGRTLVDIDTGKDQAVDIDFGENRVSADTSMHVSTFTNLVGVTIWYS